MLGNVLVRVVHVMFIAIYLCSLIMGCTHPNNDDQTTDRISHLAANHAAEPSRDPVNKQVKAERLQQIQQAQQTQTEAAQRTNNQKLFENKLNQARLVKGIYLSGWVASGEKLNQLIQLVEHTPLNAMVIDIKDDRGQVTYDSQVALVNEMGSDRTRAIPDMAELIYRLKSKGIYTIGRLVVFKDPLLAGKKPSWAMQRKAGGVWQDTKGSAWADPYHEKVWQYNIEIAQEAASLGFDEIQFDYVRFPENGHKVDQEVQFQNPHQWSKAEGIQQFLKKAKQAVREVGGLVSADVFGLTTTENSDMGIGQTWDLISQEVDVISPMIYPSHYAKGTYGVPDPDLSPAVIVNRALSDALDKNKRVALLRALTQDPISMIRPWLQDFTATWVHPHQKYGYNEVMSQINAAQNQGIDQYLLWNSRCEYSLK